jgi:hypothetical protein
VLTEVASPPLLAVVLVVVPVVEAALALIDIDDIEGPTGFLLQAENINPAAKNAHIAMSILFIVFTSFYAYIYFELALR